MLGVGCAGACVWNPGEISKEPSRKLLGGELPVNLSELKPFWWVQLREPSCAAGPASMGM